MKYQVHVVGALLLSLALAGLAWVMFGAPSASAQLSDTCSSNHVLAIDTANKRYKCVSANLLFRAKTLNVNQANTDIATISGLPSRYVVRRMTWENCTATPTLATVDLRTAASGGGSAIVSASALATLSATTTYLDSTLAVTTTVQTSSTLTVRGVAAAGGAATCDTTIEVMPLL